MQASMDMLSRLPDDVVFLILSFLPIKNSVRTSLLSKRWRFLWEHVPCFGFTKIIDNQVTPLHNLVNAFHIGVSTSNHDLESWIQNHVLAHKVRELVIDLNYQLTLPRCLFTCESLVYLRILNCGGIVGEDTAVCFPALKKLELVNVGYDSDKSLDRLVSRCPVLEELKLERVKGECCDATSLSLTSLVIDVDEVNLLIFQNPSLRYLRLCVRKCNMLTGRALNSLIEADIDLMDESNLLYATMVLDSINNMYNVKCLKLSTRPMNVDNSWFLRNMERKFHNLTDLNLRTDWRFITIFFEKASNLRVLTITPMVDHNSQCWMEPKQVPECLTSHLESVTLVEFGWFYKHEFDLVKYILKNGKLLKKVEIVCTHQNELDSDLRLEAFKRISMFEIGSQTCQLSFTSHV